jgi:hypothetical protein
MQSYYTFIALELAEERTREAERQRLASLSRAARGGSERSIRRSAALILATLSRGSAAIARRLDDGVADDLGAPLGSDRLATTH